MLTHTFSFLPVLVRIAYSLGRAFLAAEAGRLDGHIGPCDGEIETLLDDRRFHRLAPPHQTFVQAVQAPDIVRMLTGTAQRFVETKVGAIGRLRFLDPPLPHH